MHENVFGDPNFIIKESTFDALDSLQTDRHTSWEDCDFLACLNLSGYRQTALAVKNFWYRYSEGHFSRLTSQ